jgi:PelA/Pel-15E family pectate lyase
MAPAMVVVFSMCVAAQAQPSSRGIRWSDCLRQTPEWYGSAEAVRIADNVLLYQHDNGGWGKNIDMARVLSDDDRAEIRATKDRVETLIDNGATHSQIRYLARVRAATGQQRFAKGCRRGLEFLLAAQYDNGGWPMIYPIRHGYYQHITFNDGAMIGVMRVLRDVSQGKRPFGFVDSDLRRRARLAIDKGLQAILACQVVVDGRPTAWCAQHDEVDFHPQQARSYELPSLSGMESVGIVEYLMEIDDPSPEVKRAIRSAVKWFDDVKITGLRIEYQRDSKWPRGYDRVLVADPSARPLWARFYEIGSNRPMFVSRDGVVHDHLADIPYERRVGYQWIGNSADELLERKYPAWQRKWGDD